MPKHVGKKSAAEKKSTMTGKNKTGDKSLSAPTSKTGGGRKEIGEALTKTAAVKETETKKKVPPVAAEGNGQEPVLSETEEMVESISLDPSEVRALVREKKELLVRIKELELDRTKRNTESVRPEADVEEVSEESRIIVQIVKDLEAQLDNAFSVTEALEADLANVQAKLVEETGVRSELQARVQLLEAKAALVEQLQDELSFVEEERAEVAQKFKEKELELDRTTKEHDELAERMIAADAHIDTIEQAKLDLEAQVLNLEEKVADLNKVTEELAQVEDVRDNLLQEVKDVTRRLNAGEASRKALESDLSASHKMTSGLQEELKELQKKLGDRQVRLTDVSDQLEQQQIANRTLVETNGRLEREAKALKAKNEIIAAELETTKKALHEIHTAAVRTTKRVHSRYYESTKSKKD